MDIEEFKEIFVKNTDEMLKEDYNTYMIAQCTNRLIIAEKEEIKEDYENIFKYGIDVRIFNKKSEIKYFRGNIDKEFKIRKRKDENCEGAAEKAKFNNDGNDCWDEEQYLDIDTKKGKDSNGNVTAIGGGKYKLPLSDINDVKIRIRNYVKYEEETGRAYIYDWRIVDFC